MACSLEFRPAHQLAECLQKRLYLDGSVQTLSSNSSPLVDDVEVGDIRVAGVRAMAFQSVIGVAVANYPEPKDDGHSFAVGASGQILAMGGKQQAVVYADFDLDDLKAARDKEWFRRVR